MPTHDTETLAEVLRVQLRAYTLPANVRTYLYAEDTHDTMAERAGAFLADTILGSDWLAARDAQTKAEALARFAEIANTLWQQGEAESRRKNYAQGVAFKRASIVVRAATTPKETRDA